MFTGGDLQTNAFLVEAPGGLVLFDAPEGVTDWLLSTGQTPCHLILTHGHYDHILDAARIVASFNCPVSCGREDIPMVEEPGFFRRWGVPIDVNPVKVSHPIEGGGILSLCGREFQVSHVPGHSPGSYCFYMVDLDLLVGGDVLFSGGVGRWDLPGGDGARLIEGIANHLLPLPDQTVVLPGHGPATSIGRERITNPFLQAVARLS